MSRYSPREIYKMIFIFGTKNVAVSFRRRAIGDPHLRIEADTVGYARRCTAGFVGLAFRARSGRPSETPGSRHHHARRGRLLVLQWVRNALRIGTRPCGCARPANASRTRSDPADGMGGGSGPHLHQHRRRAATMDRGHQGLLPGRSCAQPVRPTRHDNERGGGPSHGLAPHIGAGSARGRGWLICWLA